MIMPCAAAISSGGTAAARVVAVKHRKKKEAEEGEVEVKRTKVGRGCAWINRQKLPYQAKAQWLYQPAGKSAVRAEAPGGPGPQSHAHAAPRLTLRHLAPRAAAPASPRPIDAPPAPSGPAALGPGCAQLFTSQRLRTQASQLPEVRGGADHVELPVHDPREGECAEPPCSARPVPRSPYLPLLTSDPPA